MPLPDFREDGWLPEGHHAATWEEIAARFGGTPGSRRAEVLASLLAWRDAARASGLGGLMVLNGSFISTKEAPGDFDLFFLYDEASEARIAAEGQARDLTQYQACREAGYLGDVFALPASLARVSPLLGGADMFDTDRNGRAKGVVEVTL